jgi:hypothetical protein
MFTNKKITGLILIGIAGVFIAFSLLFVSRSMSIIDYGEVNMPGIGCDSCEFSREALLLNALILAIMACIPGAAAARILIRV